jgi:4-alpha-glucanotransferase
MIDAPRSSGVQCHVTSLPGGRLGPAAYAFVDWLSAAGQSWWQVLPLGPPDKYRSPYKAESAFAAWSGLLERPDAPVSETEREAFRAANAYWVGDWEDYAGSGAIDDQVRFDREWGDLRRYARERGVRLIGDVAIYVAPASADHVAHPELFQSGVVAGVPPDAFSDDGQLWGNPLYDWPALRRRGYRWWVERIGRTLDLFDLVRIDHFRGLVSYWAVPDDAPTAASGRWKRGPGRALFRALSAALGNPLPIVAEDLGVITPAVEGLRDELGLPGMAVLQFGFDPEATDSPHRVGNIAENRIVYTGTHDNDTTRGWYESLDEATRAAVDAALRSTDADEPWWGLIELAWASPARVAMTQVQDVLGLGSEARMNVPGSGTDSWRWQMEAGALTDDLARRLREVTEVSGRLVG